jgi:hypothetical protein
MYLNVFLTYLRQVLRSPIPCHAWTAGPERLPVTASPSQSSTGFSLNSNHTLPCLLGYSSVDACMSEACWSLWQLNVPHPRRFLAIMIPWARIKAANGATPHALTVHCIFSKHRHSGCIGKSKLLSSLSVEAN